MGIGSARAASLQQSRIAAAALAREEISRQMIVITEYMFLEYQAAGELNLGEAGIFAEAFQEIFTFAISLSTLPGTFVAEEFVDLDGTVYSVVWLGKSDILSEFNLAQAATKRAVPEMAAFDALGRFDQAFTGVAMEAPRVNTR